jgi:hypothetical protein
MAAIVYFQKTVEDTDHVTYRFGLDENNLDESFLISKADQRPTGDPEESTFSARLAFRGIIRGYQKLGRWPERGAGYT